MQVGNGKTNGVQFMLEGVGKVTKNGRSIMVRVPVDVVRDSTFPFRQGEEVSVQICDGGLRVVAVLKREAEVVELMSKQ